MLDTARGLNTAVLCAALLAVAVAGWHIQSPNTSELFQVLQRPSHVAARVLGLAMCHHSALRSWNAAGPGKLAWRRQERSRERFFAQNRSSLFRGPPVVTAKDAWEDSCVLGWPSTAG